MCQYFFTTFSDDFFRITKCHCLASQAGETMQLRLNVAQILYTMFPMHTTFSSCTIVLRHEVSRYRTCCETATEKSRFFSVPPPESTLQKINTMNNRKTILFCVRKNIFLVWSVTLYTILGRRSIRIKKKKEKPLQNFLWFAQDLMCVSIIFDSAEDDARQGSTSLRFYTFISKILRLGFHRFNEFNQKILKDDRHGPMICVGYPKYFAMHIESIWGHKRFYEILLCSYN